MRILANRRFESEHPNAYIKDLCIESCSGVFFGTAVRRNLHAL